MWKSALVFWGAVVLALTLAPSRAHAWGSPRNGFGIGIGSGTGATGVSAKVMAGPGAFQGVVGFWGAGEGFHQYSSIDGVALSLDYLFEMPTLVSSQYFNIDWDFGFGGGVGIPTRGGDVGFGAAGIAGLEFNFTRVPLDLALEYRPSVGIVPGFGIQLVGFTAHLRVWF
jgi:hypothetical protein